MGLLRACPACSYALEALTVREFDSTEPGLPETHGNVTSFSKAQISHTQCLFCTPGSGR